MKQPSRAIISLARSGGGSAWPTTWSSVLTTSRAAVATHWDGTIYRTFASNEARILPGEILYGEGARQNKVKFHVFSNTNWASAGSTIMANADTSPDGTITAGESSPVNGGGRYQGLSPSIASGLAGTVSAWVKAVSVTGTVKIGLNTFATNNDVIVPIAAEWSRQSAAITSTGTSFFTYRLNTELVYLWGAQVEQASFASQFIASNTGTETLRTADSNKIADGDVWSGFRTSDWSFNITPRRASTQTNDTAEDILWDFGSDYKIYIDSSNRVTVEEGGVIRVQSSALTWSADQSFLITQRPSSGQITVSGAATGNGTSTGTSWSWPVSGDIQVGNDSVLGNAFFGGISFPVEV